MNFDDDDGRQRPIGGNDALDRKIVDGPSPYGIPKKKKRNRRIANDAEAFPINDADVLSGRGKTSFNHPGNKRFRDLVTSSIPEYNKSESRLAKSLVVHSICESIRSSGGRFLKADGSTGQWRELDDRACREKVSHAIRDAATTTQTRREKKKRLQSQSSNLMSGPSARYNEMKLDTPDPVNFHDIMHFSNLMSGPRPDLSLEPRPLPEPMGNSAGELEPKPLPEPAFDGSREPELQRLAHDISDTHAHVPRLEQPPDELNFLAEINQVLGPMPSGDETDPLAHLLDSS